MSGSKNKRSQSGPSSNLRFPVRSLSKVMGLGAYDFSPSPQPLGQLIKPHECFLLEKEIHLF